MPACLQAAPQPDLQAVPREVVEKETDHGEQTYDVYVHDAQPLAAGEEKHMLSVFVADEKGLINRVAGVFARRGAAATPLCLCFLGCIVRPLDATAFVEPRPT